MCVCVCNWLILCSIISLRFIHIVACDRISFSFNNNIPFSLLIHTTFSELICPPIGHPFGWLSLVGYWEQCSMNPEMRFPLSDTDFSFGRYILRSGTIGSYSISLFNFWRNLHAVFHSSCTVSHSHPTALQFLRIPPQHCPLQRSLL